jgi:WD40 repeat protein
MSPRAFLFAAGLLLAASLAASGQEVEPSQPAPDPTKPVEPAATPIIKAIGKAIGLGQGGPRAVPLTPELKARVDRAITDLADEDFHMRESAALRLIEIGQPALAALQNAGRSTDAEVRFRAEQLATIVQSRIINDSRVLSAHDDIVWTVAYSNSGRLLASGGGGRQENGQWLPGSDFAIRLWNPSTGKVLRSMEGHTSSVNRVNWSANDRLLLSASSDGTARIWRIRDGSEYRIFRAHEGAVTQALFTPDEREVVTSGWDKTIRIWDVATGKEVQHINWPHGRVWCCDLSPDGSLLAVCGDNSIIRLYDFKTRERVGELKGHTNNAVFVAFSPDGAQLASGGWDNTARIWNVKDRTLLRSLTEHTGRVEGLAWSGDGRHLVTGCLDNMVRVYDADRGTLLRVFAGHTQSVSKVAVSPLGDTIASGGWDSDIHLWSTTGLARVEPVPATVEPIKVLPR